MPILIAVTTGLRRGEILGLRWHDIDLEARTLAVRQTVELSRAGLGSKEPKTPKSWRSIVIPPLLVDALRTHKLEQAKRRLELGPAYRDLDLVCAAADGGPRRIPTNSLGPSRRPWSEPACPMCVFTT